MRDLSSVVFLGLGLVTQWFDVSIYTVLTVYSLIALPVAVFALVCGQKKR